MRAVPVFVSASGVAWVTGFAARFAVTLALSVDVGFGAAKTFDFSTGVSSALGLGASTMFLAVYWL